MLLLICLSTSLYLLNESVYSQQLLCLMLIGISPNLILKVVFLFNGFLVLSLISAFYPERKMKKYNKEIKLKTKFIF